MNLYRGCQHRCIYCDSRSECYQIEDFDGEVIVKVNAVDLLADQLPRKRIKGTIGTGSMNDPYMPIEKQYNLTGQALAVIAENRFPVHVLTKSDLVLRDIDTLTEISKTFAAVSFTITTADDQLGKKLEPGAPLVSRRFKPWPIAQRGIHTGVLLMPLLPMIEDTPENVSRHHPISRRPRRQLHHPLLRDDHPRPPAGILLCAARQALQWIERPIPNTIWQPLFCPCQ